MLGGLLDGNDSKQVVGAGCAFFLVGAAALYPQLRGSSTGWQCTWYSILAAAVAGCCTYIMYCPEPGNGVSASTILSDIATEGKSLEK